MSCIANCNLAKAASAIFAYKDEFDSVKLYSAGDESFKFSLFDSSIGNCTIEVSGSPNSVIIEVSVPRKHELFGHPEAKFALELHETESNETYVNAARLALAVLSQHVSRTEQYIDGLYRTVFDEKTSYEFDEKNKINDVPAKILAYNLKNKLPDSWMVNYKQTKDPDVKDSVDKYVDVDLGDVDIGKATAVASFFGDLYNTDEIYRDCDKVYPMMLNTVCNSLNWALKKAGSDEKVDCKTVLAALMSCSLKSKHMVFDANAEIRDNMRINVPDSIFDFVIMSRKYK